MPLLLSSARAEAGWLDPPDASWASEGDDVPCMHPQAELNSILKDYVGRETPLYYADRLSKHYAK